MWAYPGSTYPDHPSPEKLSAAEVETRICKVLDFVAVPPPSVGLDPLQIGITSIRVGTSGSVFAAFKILSLHRARDIVQGLWDRHGDTRGADFSMDAPGRAMSHASNQAVWLHEERERERDRRAAGRAARKRGTGTLTKSSSSDEGETD
jgi:hypothetical protein